MFKCKINSRSAAGSYFFGNLPSNGDELPAPGDLSRSPIMITHYIEDSDSDNIFISRWWLQENREAIYNSPYQPRDTRLSVYNMRNHIHLQPSDLLVWRRWRNNILNLDGNQISQSDVALSWQAADIQILNAVCKTPAEAISLKLRTDLVALSNFLWWRKKSKCPRNQ